MPYLMTLVVAVLLAHRLGLGKEISTCSVSVGLASAQAGSPDSLDPEDLVCAADAALYSAKAKGRNWVESLPWYLQPGRETSDPVLGWHQAGWHVGGTALARLGHSHEAREDLVLWASSSGGGLPGRPLTRKSRDARLIFGG